MKQILSRILISIIIFIAFISEMNAQFSIKAQYRNRFEIRDGYKAIVEAGTSPAIFISQRTRLTFEYKNKFLKLKFTPQDVRLWGDEDIATSTGVFGNKSSLDLYEAYVQIKLTEPFWISIGRQQLAYDNQRLLAARNWNQLGISYDAMVAKYNTSGWQFHLAGSWNTLLETFLNNYYPSDRIKTLNYLWVHKKISQGFELSFLHIASGKTESDTTNKLYFRQTSGLYINYFKNNFSANADMYYQYGKNNTGSSVSAFLLDADVSCSLGKVRPGIGMGYLSGNHTIGSSRKVDRLFDVLYGARHRYFGNMDYFRDFRKHTQDGGLVDLYVYLEYQVCPSLLIRNSGHYFSLAQTNPNTPVHKYLAFENDLVLKYIFRTWGALEGGYSFMILTASLKELQQTCSEKTPQFIYLQLTIKPLLYTHHVKN